MSVEPRTTLLACQWKGYNEEELRRLLHLHRTDFFVFPLLAPLLVGLLSLLLPPPAGADAALRATPTTTTSMAAAAVLLFLSFVPLYMHVYVMPMNKKTESEQEWAAMSILGRWPFLTRWGLTLQPVYFALSLIGEVTGALGPRRAAYALAVPIASVGIFVTVQFYTLVTRAPAYPEVVARWTARGVAYERMQALVHAPAALLGLADLHVAKGAALLQNALPAYGSLVQCNAAFALLYLTVISANKLATGHYPYMMMAKLDTIGKFGRFALVQVGVFQVFLLLAWLPVHFL